MKWIVNRFEKLNICRQSINILVAFYFERVYICLNFNSKTKLIFKHSNMDKRNNSIFGIIAIIMAILTFFTPRIFLIFPIAVGLIFGLIGLFKKGGRILSLISLALIGLILYSVGKSSYEKEVAEIKFYDVKYEVIGQTYDITYQNQTGGSDHEVGSGTWEKNLRMQGSDFAYISAQNSKYSKKITVNIYINDVLCQTSTSSGNYAIANVSCYPKSCCK